MFLSKSYDKFPEQGVYTWETYLDYEGDILTMPYTMTRTDFNKDREFCFNYTAAVKSGKINEYDTDELQEYAFPIEIKEGKLSYHFNGGSERVTLIFEEKPEYTFTRTCYEINKRNIIKEEKENLVLMQNRDGMWYLTPENEPNAYFYSYVFDKEQDLEYR